jgi:hypothetical protein
VLSFAPPTRDWRQRIAADDEIKEPSQDGVFVAVAPIARITDPGMAVGFKEFPEDNALDLNTSCRFGDDRDASAEGDRTQRRLACDVVHVDLRREARHSQLVLDEAARLRPRISLRKQEAFTSQVRPINAVTRGERVILR